MLNISPNSINNRIPQYRFDSFGKVSVDGSHRSLIRILWIMLTVFVLSTFLPWTQNVRSPGELTSLRPDQRPQSIQSVIAGRIERWYVQEGDYVQTGDTILFLTEVKEKYMDPAFLRRTKQQIEAKKLSAQSYQAKAAATDDQIRALQTIQQLKLKQAKNKYQQARLQVASDSIDFEAAKVAMRIAEAQFKRADTMYQRGIISLVKYEARNNKMQAAQAKRISGENKLLSSRNKLINAQIELSTVENEYRDKLAKSRSERFAAISQQYTAEGDIVKMESKFSSDSVRFRYYYITAPQNGYITKAITSGIGETIKEGTSIVSVMPAEYQLAVEMYVSPMDLPLIHHGQKVRIWFDGWPVIIFSGWPQVSYGTYGGKVVAIDNFVSMNGKYRMLVAQDPEDHPWPEELRPGSGAMTLTLLKDVPIWYELWRQFNGFPPDYYQTNDKVESGKKDEKKKK